MPNIRLLENAKTGEEAHKWLLVNQSSYSRMGALLAARKNMQWQVFYKALGLIWTISDDIARHRFVLYRVFANASRYQLNLMMDTKEKRVLEKMPEIIKIYRGCYSHNLNGLSWSIDREIAAQFTLQNRYHYPEKERLLREANIRREHAVLMLGRNEQEIIATKVIKPIKTVGLGVHLK